MEAVDSTAQTCYSEAMTTQTTERLESLLLSVERAKYGDSNDRELEALRDALDEAISLIPAVIDTEAIEEAAEAEYLGEL